MDNRVFSDWFTLLHRRREKSRYTKMLVELLNHQGIFTECYLIYCFFFLFFNPFAQIWKWIFQGNSYWVYGQDSLTDFSCLVYGEIAFFGLIASLVFVAIVLILIFWDELLTDMAIPGWPYFWVLQVQEKQPCCTHLPGNSTRIWRFVSHSIAFICVTICIILCVWD